MYYFYILKSQNAGTFYLGQSENVHKRVLAHRAGKSKYTSRHKDWILVHWEQFPSRPEAFKREQQVKKWKSRARICALMNRQPISFCPL